MLTVKAPAKINWFLKVIGLRNDGYHDIESLMQKISLYDDIDLSPSQDLTLLTDLRIPVSQNLVYKAAVLLKKKYNVRAGAEIRLSKNIPVDAGLGGGSSDAASTLLGLNKVWSLGLSRDELCVLAEQIGSDVPFFLYGPLAVVKGRGDRIISCESTKPFNILLVKPSVNVSTRWAYESLKSVRGRESPESIPGGDSCQSNGLSGIDSGLTKRIDKVENNKFFMRAIGKACSLSNSRSQNDLESVTAKSFPVIDGIKKKLISEGAVYSLMSGSGPTVFGVFNSDEEAVRASKVFKDCWTAAVRTITN